MPWIRFSQAPYSGYLGDIAGTEKFSGAGNHCGDDRSISGTGDYWLRAVDLSFCGVAVIMLRYSACSNTLHEVAFSHAALTVSAMLLECAKEGKDSGGRQSTSALYVDDHCCTTDKGSYPPARK